MNAPPAATTDPVHPAQPPVRLPHADALPPGGYHPPHTLLPAREESAGVARRRLVRVLGRWGLGELADDAGLVVSELAANAVAHLRALGPVRSGGSG